MIYIPLLFVIAITIVTVAMGFSSRKTTKTASDVFVAGRAVSPFWNASAISGEYLSAASFMGIAGMLMKNGYDALWYPVGYATGYLFLLLFIAGPLRRFGAYTIPDFAEGRFDSPAFRKIAVVLVLMIGLFYCLPQMKGAGVTVAALIESTFSTTNSPQMKGAGVTMVSILNWPYYAGILVVGTVITFNVALGGMKGITIVQAMQYWAKLFAISAPIFVLMAVYGAYNSKLDENLANPRAAPRFAPSALMALNFKGKKDAPANAVAFSSIESTHMIFQTGAVIDKVSPARKPKPGEDPMPSLAAAYWLPRYGERQTDPKGPGDPKNPNEPPVHYVDLAEQLKAAPEGAGARIPSSAEFYATPFTVTKQGKPVIENGRVVKTAPKIEFLESASVIIAPPSPVPNAPANKKWIEPFGTLTGKYNHPLLYTYSLIIALVCGTAGLPHILVRFYTNPDGRSAKRTTMLVMIMLGCFYVFTPMWGTLGRALAPQLYANNTTDSVVIKLPMALDNQLLGLVLSGITSAGAFAAFMSTFSGLLVSMSGAMAHDIYGRMIRPQSSPKERLAAFKVAAVIFGAIAMALGLAVESFDINMMVGWAFAIAAASYFPLLLLGSWWRGLTKYGAAVGMLGGGLLSLAAIITSMLLDKKILAFEVSPIVRTLMEQPAIWGVPLAILVMVAVSRATERHIPGDAHLKMLRLHAPEEMGLSKDYIAEH